MASDSERREPSSAPENTPDSEGAEARLQTIVSLCKRRGFVF